eukprot:TRINITY_DN13525_c0_g1_i1.p2 TRINITY_DN13525_c0_g1~~TRINITY_DN13525_c0_g1_i1.p2  ORF type:complete len:60 (+),score=11.60 TRINITY_DN13525_c0_g1_i1:169-348(+)
MNNVGAKRTNIRGIGDFSIEECIPKLYEISAPRMHWGSWNQRSVVHVAHFVDYADPDRY